MDEKKKNNLDNFSNTDDKIMTYQLNPLIDAQKNFDLIESKIFYLGLQDINPHISVNDNYYDKDFPYTHIKTKQLKEIFGYNAIIRDIDKATSKLIGRHIIIKFDGDFRKVAIFSEIVYKSKDGLFIKFNNAMRPFLLDIYRKTKEGYTRIDLKQIFNLHSVYAIRLLELMIRNRYLASDNNKDDSKDNKKNELKYEISVEDLRYFFNMREDAYRLMTQFRINALDKPIKDINKYTKYDVKYITLKEGRKVTGFIFICDFTNVLDDLDFKDEIEAEKTEEIKEDKADNKSKKENKKDKETETIKKDDIKENNSKTEEKTENEDNDKIVNLLIETAGKYGIDEQLVKDFIETKGIDCVKNNMKLAIKQSQDGKTSGYIINFIKRDEYAIQKNQKKTKEEFSRLKQNITNNTIKNNERKFKI